MKPCRTVMLSSTQSLWKCMGVPKIILHLQIVDVHGFSIAMSLWRVLAWFSKKKTCSGRWLSRSWTVLEIHPCKTPAWADTTSTQSHHNLLSIACCNLHQIGWRFPKKSLRGGSYIWDTRTPNPSVSPLKIITFESFWGSPLYTTNHPFSWTTSACFACPSSLPLPHPLARPSPKIGTGRDSVQNAIYRYINSCGKPSPPTDFQVLQPKTQETNITFFHGKTCLDQHCDTPRQCQTCMVSNPRSFQTTKLWPHSLIGPCWDMVYGHPTMIHSIQNGPSVDKTWLTTAPKNCRNLGTIRCASSPDNSDFQISGLFSFIF
jgi:hypothetical protein